MESKIEKLKKWLDEKPANWWGTSKTMSHIWGKVCMLVAEEQAESHPATLEPLAAIANKRHYVLSQYEVKGVFWVVLYYIKMFDTLNGIPPRKYFNGLSYAACEQLARTWLEEQEDKK